MFHSVHEVRVELGSKHVIYLKLARFTQKKDIYASRLESVFESVYSRPELNANGGPHGTEF